MAIRTLQDAEMASVFMRPTAGSPIRLDLVLAIAENRPVKTVMDKYHITRQGLQRHVQKLKNEGVIESYLIPGKSSTDYRLTEKGKFMYERFYPVLFRIANEAKEQKEREDLNRLREVLNDKINSGNLSPEELKTLEGVLAKLKW